MLKTGMVLNERYEIEQTIGEGGMAIVYKGYDHKAHREVAVKVLRPELSSDETILSKFRKEGMNASRLSHPNIVAVYDVGRQADADYIIMEYIDGMTLKEYISRRGHLTNDEILKVSSKIADALKSAHESGIIHRDIKPQNIMVTPKGAVKVTDFGIAKATTATTVTSQGEMMGSVHYFSPEQARGQRADARSDLYSLGITMYEMATNSLPFEGDTPVSTAMMQIHEPLPDLYEKNPDLLPGIVGIIQKLTNKRPEDRYQNADEVIEDLKRVYQDPEYVPVAAPQGRKQTTGHVPQENQHSSNYDDYDYDDYDQYDDDDEVRKGSSRFRNRMIIWIAVGVVCLAAIGVLIWFLVTHLGGSSTSSTVPYLVGSTEEDAQEKAENAGYEITIESWQYDDTYESGVVISQDPVSGTKADEGSTISVILSMGTYDSSDMPDLTGQSYEDAVDVLVDLGVPYTVETESSTEVEMGVIISQSPESGTEIDSDTEVTIVVSTGSVGESIEVPDLTGMTETEAEAALNELNLTLGEVSLSYHETVEEGKIIAQDLDEGTLVSEGSAVNVTISQGEPDENEEEDTSNGSILITNPLDEDTTSGELLVEAVDSDGETTTLYEQTVTSSTFGSDGLEISYPTGTIKIRVYLDGEEIFVRDIN